MAGRVRATGCARAAGCVRVAGQRQRPPTPAPAAKVLRYVAPQNKTKPLIFHQRETCFQAGNII